MDLGVLSGQIEGFCLDRCQGIRIDVSGNCNLRCPYCINDFDQVHGNLLMTEQTFDRAVTLLPLLRPGGHTLFSCFFEPTLNPEFLSLLERVPEENRGQAGFTTNLAKRLPDSFFARLGQLGLGYVNVSLDSLVPEVFQEMRKPARFDVFRDNLERLARYLDNGAQKTELHLITMVSRCNLEEIPELIRECRDLYAPKRHEVRAIWMTEEIRKRPWIVEQAPSLDELLSLRRRLFGGSPSNLEFVLDLPDNPEAFSLYPDRLPPLPADPGKPAEDGMPDILRAPPVEPILQINSQGSVRFLMTGCAPVLELKDHPEPFDAVKRLLELQNLAFGRALLLREASREATELRRLSRLNQRLADGRLGLDGGVRQAVGRLDEIKKVGAGRGGAASYRTSGWARKADCPVPAEEVVLVLEAGERRWAVGSAIPDAQRFDVADHFSDSRLLYTGWGTGLHLDALIDSFPTRFHLAAYAIDPKQQVGYKLDGECDVELD